MMLCYCYANLHLLKRLKNELDPDDKLEFFLESAAMDDDDDDDDEEIVTVTAEEATTEA